MNPLINIKIKIWQNNIKYEEYNITNDIYQDDKCDYVIFKIKKILKINHNIYGWKDDNTPMDFCVKSNWPGYNINPFKININNIPKTDNINYITNSSILNTTEINIISIDILDKRIQKYYTLERHIQNINEEQIKLLHPIIPAEIINQYISRYNLFTSTELHITSFYNIFFKKDLNRDCIIWVKDNNRILYKLLKKNKIPLIFLNKINDEFFTHETLNILYGHLGNQSIIRLDITKTGLINIEMIFNLRDKISLDNIPSINNILTDLEIITRKKIQLTEGLIKTVLYIRYNKSKTVLYNNLNKYPSFFDTYKEYTIYKRSSIDKNFNIDDIKFIKNKLKDGSDIKDIVKELQIYFPDATNEDLVTKINNIDNNIIDEQNIKKLEQKTILFLDLQFDKKILKIEISNIYKNELEFFKYWFLRIINIQENINTPVKIDKKKTDDLVIYKNSNSDSTSSLDSAKSDISGGGGGDFDIIHLLQNKDPELFKNYAKGCQRRQPMVSDIDLFESKKMAEKVDNYIYYGSPGNKKHAYFCPR